MGAHSDTGETSPPSNLALTCPHSHRVLTGPNCSYGLDLHSVLMQFYMCSNTFRNRSISIHNIIFYQNYNPKLEKNHLCLFLTVDHF